MTTSKPKVYPEWHPMHERMQGMTLRDYFAAKAMQSILDQKDAHDGRECENTAWMAYRQADAMLKAREQ